MKIEYDVNLYKEIANFRVNEIVQVSHRKDRVHSIHITNITKLSWQELQLLSVHGTDKFSKMVYLYKALSNSVTNEKTLSPQEVKEMEAYIQIYRDYSCTKHHEVNEIITQKEIWDNFKTIRSLNDHGIYNGIKGIQPKYFSIVCSILNISGEGGLSIDSYTKY